MHNPFPFHLRCNQSCSMDSTGLNDTGWLAGEERMPWLWDLWTGGTTLPCKDNLSNRFCFKLQKHSECYVNIFVAAVILISPPQLGKTQCLLGRDTEGTILLLFALCQQNGDSGRHILQMMASLSLPTDDYSATVHPLLWNEYEQNGGRKNQRETLFKQSHPISYLQGKKAWIQT